MRVYFFTSTGRVQSLAFNIASAQFPEHEWSEFVLDTPEKRAEFEAGDHRPDVILSFLNPYVVPPRYLEMTAGRAYNVHPAPPSHPGAQAFHFAAYAGDWVAGATLHQMAVQVDSGEIYDVLEVPVEATRGISHLVERSKELGLGILLRNLEGILAGPLTPSGRAWSTAERHTESDFQAMTRIDPSIDAPELERRIAAFYSPERQTPYVELHGARFVYSPGDSARTAATPAATNGSSAVSADDVMAFVVAELDQPLREAGVDPAAVSGDFDLYAAGLIDSFGLIELIASVEERFSLDVDFEELDPESMTVLGPLSSFIAAAAR